MNIKNTNIEIKNGTVVMNFTTQSRGFGDRLIVFCNQDKSKKILNKYKKLGFFQSCCTFFDGVNFFKLTKQLKQSTINKRQVVISNELWHIEKHISKGGKITIEL